LTSSQQLDDNRASEAESQLPEISGSTMSGNVVKGNTLDAEYEEFQVNPSIGL